MQSASGLGLEAQQAAVSSYQNGESWRRVGAFTEVENGRNSDQPELAKALAEAGCIAHSSWSPTCRGSRAR